MGILRRVSSARGASLGEYALLLFAILIVGALGIKALGDPVKQNADDARAWLEGDGPVRNGSGSSSNSSSSGSSSRGGTVPGGEGTGDNGKPTPNSFVSGGGDPTGDPNSSSSGGSSSGGSSSGASSSGGSSGSSSGGTVFGTTASTDPSGATPNQLTDSRNTIGQTATTADGTPEGTSKQGLADKTVSANDEGTGEPRTKDWTAKELAIIAARTGVSMVPGGSTAEALYDLYNGEQTVAGVLKTAVEEVGDKTIGRAMSVYRTGEAVYDYATGNGSLGNVAVNAIGIVGGRKSSEAAKRAVDGADDAAKAGGKFKIPERFGEKADDFGGGVAGTTRKNHAVGEEVVVPRSNGGESVAKVASKNADGTVTVKWEENGQRLQKTVDPAVLKRVENQVGDKVVVPRSNGSESVAEVASRNADGTVTVKWEENGQRLQKTVDPSALKKADDAPSASAVARKVDARTAAVTNELLDNYKLTRDSKLYRSVDPQFLDQASGTLKGNPNSIALVNDHYNKIEHPHLPGSGHMIPDRVDANSLKTPGLNVTVKPPRGDMGYHDPGRVLIEVKVGDLLDRGARIYPDHGAMLQGMQPLYVTFDGAVPYKVIPVPPR